MPKISGKNADDDGRTRYPDSDELAMLISLLCRLYNAGIVSEATLKAAIEELNSVVAKGEPPAGGLTKEFRIVFQDGAVFDSDGSKRR